ncbi:MAG TPA: PQQ-dependent sugar dehydrogenase [Pseudonocardiaceae bacterium]|nr:PQQ-dependent sugar dehydrogenase [Pseudonocardiaceae bacterium]
MTTRPPRRRLLGALALAVASVLGAAGCASFASAATPQSWASADPLPPETGPSPSVPGSGGGQGAVPGAGGDNSAPVPPPQGCEDFNPAVIATCLDTVDAVAALPGTADDPVGLAAERTTGRILKVHKGDAVATVATLTVDPTGDGGLTGLALSPTYTQDQLIFAYITTPTDNRVVRIAPGDTPKPVLTGIPRGSTDNRGVLALDHTGALLVATGDAGNPALSADPTSLAGKVLRIDVDGAPAVGDPTPGSPIVASGLVDPGGVCSSLDGSAQWVTDRKPAEDVLYRIAAGKALSEPAWTWPDRPGVAGCAAFSTSVMVATAIAGNVQSISLNSDGSFTGTPQVALSGAGGFGRLSGVDIINDSTAMAGTVNKDGGKPVSSDDRVVVISGSAATGGGQD